MKFIRNTLNAAAFISLFLTSAVPVFSAPAISIEATSKWVIKLKVEEENNKYQCQGSSIQEIEKTELSYYSTAGLGQEPCKYDSLWLKKDKPIGLEPYEQLDFPENNNVALRLCMLSNNTR